MGNERVAVVGGGIAGLAAALRLRERLGPDATITVFERSAALGGKLRTGELAGAPQELGAETFLAGDPAGGESAAVLLARRVGLGDRLVHPGTTQAALVIGGALKDIPAGTVMGVPDDPARVASVARVTPGADVDSGRPLLHDGEDVAVGALTRLRFGDEVVDRLVDPLLGGVYAGRADDLSLDMTVPGLAAAARTERTLSAAVTVAKAASARARAARAGAGRVEAPRTHAIRTPAARADAARADAARADAARADAARPDAVRADAARPDAVRADAAHGDAVRANGAGAAGLRTDAVRREGTGADAARTDGAGADAVRTDGAGADAFRADALRTDAVSDGARPADDSRPAARPIRPGVGDQVSRAGAGQAGHAGRAAQTGQTVQAGAPPIFASVEGGLSRLVEAVVVAARPEVRLGLPVRALERTGDGGWILTVGAANSAEAGERLRFDAVVLAVPAKPAARLLKDVAPHVAETIGGLDYASLALVTMALPAAELPHLSGLLIPSVEGMLIKAATFFGVKWPHQRRADGVVHVRASVGRYREEHLLQRDDAELAATAHAELSALLRHPSRRPLPQPIDTIVQRWGGALPQYAPGHRQRIASARELLRASHPTVVLAGAGYDGVGIPLCVRSGEIAGDEVADVVQADSQRSTVSRENA